MNLRLCEAVDTLCIRDTDRVSHAVVGAPKNANFNNHTHFVMRMLTLLPSTIRVQNSGG